MALLHIRENQCRGDTFELVFSLDVAANSDGFAKIHLFYKQYHWLSVRSLGRKENRRNNEYSI